MSTVAAEAASAAKAAQQRLAAKRMLVRVVKRMLASKPGASGVKARHVMAVVNAKAGAEAIVCERPTTLT